MADIFASSRGCVYAPNSRGGQGSYAVEGLDRGSAESPILILGADLKDSDIVLPVSTLNGIKIIYTFGEAWGDATILGLALLGSGDSSLKRLTSWFKGKRSSAGESAQTVNLSTPGGPYKLYIHAFGLAQPDEKFNTQPFMIYGKIANPKK